MYVIYHDLPTFSIFLADVPRSAGDLIEKAQQKAEAIQAAIKAREEEEKRKKEAERLRTAVRWTD
jgi:DNA gyrase/topoisomerase IV subunit B